MNNKTYDKLKWTAQIALPATAALYFGIAQIWGLPKAEEIVGTITVIDTFLGVLLGLSTKTYNDSDAPYDGEIEVDTSQEGKKLYSLNLSRADVDKLDEKTTVVFKVVSK